jgi:hypothetical protein
MQYQPANKVSKGWVPSKRWAAKLVASLLISYYVSILGSNPFKFMDGQHRQRCGQQSQGRHKNIIRKTVSKVHYSYIGIILSRFGCVRSTSVLAPGSGSSSQWCGSADPDPHPNVMDPRTLVRTGQVVVFYFCLLCPRWRRGA